MPALCADPSSPSSRPPGDLSCAPPQDAEERRLDADRGRAAGADEAAGGVPERAAALAALQEPPRHGEPLVWSSLRLLVLRKGTKLLFLLKQTL